MEFDKSGKARFEPADFEPMDDLFREVLGGLGWHEMTEEAPEFIRQRLYRSAQWSALDGRAQLSQTIVQTETDNAAGYTLQLQRDDPEQGATFEFIFTIEPEVNVFHVRRYGYGLGVKPDRKYMRQDYERRLKHDLESLIPTKADIDLFWALIESIPGAATEEQGE